MRILRAVEIRAPCVPEQRARRMHFRHWIKYKEDSPVEIMFFVRKFPSSRRSDSIRVRATPIPANQNLCNSACGPVGLCVRVCVCVCVCVCFLCAVEVRAYVCIGVRVRGCVGVRECACSEQRDSQLLDALVERNELLHAQLVVAVLVEQIEERLRLVQVEPEPSATGGCGT